MKVADRADLGVTVVALTGELALDSAPMLRAVFADLVDRGVSRIVLDASGLQFCDSVGLSVLVTSHTACRARDGFVRVAGPSDALMRLLTVVGLTEHLQAFRTVAAAAAADARERVDPVRA
ncbi:MAG: STAS domain-containing protein [Hamadaea sp.]|nr:STAS domain-containing protein [Hamadaea sp.]